MTVIDQGAAGDPGGQVTRETLRPFEHREPLAVVVAICPFLVAGGGGWRHADPSRGHRCEALRPAAPVSAEKQRRLCLVADHVGCPTFVAATGRNLDSRGRPGVARSLFPASGRWGFATTAPVVFDATGIPASFGALARARGGGQVVLAGLLVAALVAVGLTRFAPPRPVAVVPASTLSPVAMILPSALPSAATAAPTVGPSPKPSTPSATPKPSPRPTPTAGPTVRATRTYTVRQGDTLGAIALKFGTTTAVLQRLNGISDARALRVGVVLKIP